MVYQVDKIELNKEQLAIIDEYCCDGMKKLKKLCNPIIMKIGGISEKDHDDIYSLAQFLLYKMCIRDSTKSAYSNIENQNRSPSLKVAIQLQNLFGLSIEKLLENKNSNPTPTKV